MNGRFENMTEDDLVKSLKPAKALPVKFMQFSGLQAVKKHALETLDSIRRLASEVERQTADLDPGLSSAARNTRVAGIKEAVQPRLDAAMAALRQDAAQAEGQRPFWERFACLLRTTFDKAPATDAAIRMAWVARLQAMPGVYLIELARLAASQGDLSMASAITEEVFARESLVELDPRHIRRGQRLEIMALLDAIPSDAEAAQRMIAEIAMTMNDAMLVASDRRGSGHMRIMAGLQRNQ